MAYVCVAKYSQCSIVEFSLIGDDEPFPIIGPGNEVIRGWIVYEAGRSLVSAVPLGRQPLTYTVFPRSLHLWVTQNGHSR